MNKGDTLWFTGSKENDDEKLETLKRQHKLDKSMNVSREKFLILNWGTARRSLCSFFMSEDSSRGRMRCNEAGGALIIIQVVSIRLFDSKDELELTHSNNKGRKISGFTRNKKHCNIAHGQTLSKEEKLVKQDVSVEGKTFHKQVWSLRNKNELLKRKFLHIMGMCKSKFIWRIKTWIHDIRSESPIPQTLRLVMSMCSGRTIERKQDKVVIYFKILEKDKTKQPSIYIYI